VRRCYPVYSNVLLKRQTFGLPAIDDCRQFSVTYNFVDAGKRRTGSNGHPDICSFQASDESGFILSG
jgi:hypothetical protein